MGTIKNQFVKMMNIRRATLNDAQHIALLGRMTFSETFGEHFADKQDLLDYLDHTFNVPKIQSSLMKENNQYWIALWNELPIGYAKLKVHSLSEFIDKNNSSQLQKIYVLKDFLDKKAGKSLINYLMKSFYKSGNEHLWLSVLVSNRRAINFYYKNDFKQIGNHTFQIGKEVFDFQVLSHKKRSGSTLNHS